MDQEERRLMRGRRKARRKQLRRYGLDEIGYLELVEAQGSKCKNMAKCASTQTTRLLVGYDWQGKRVLGLFCRRCAAKITNNPKYRHVGPPTKDQLRERRRSLRKYGLTLETFDAWNDAQHGMCACCDEPPAERNLGVHWDARTRLIYGLICARCRFTLRGCRGSIVTQAKKFADAARYTQRLIDEHGLDQPSKKMKQQGRGKGGGGVGAI